jgi:hypothetical protein
MAKERDERSARHWGPLVATCSFAGAILVALLGGLLTASTWIFGAQTHPWLRDVGTVLMVLVIPLLIFCGCCLDWADRDTGKSEKPTRETARQRT